MHCGQEMTKRRIKGTLRTYVFRCESCGYSVAPGLKVPMVAPPNEHDQSSGFLFKEVEIAKGRLHIKNKVFVPKVALAILLGAFVMLCVSMGFQWAHSLYFFVPLIAMGKKKGRRDFLRTAALVGGGGIMGATMMGVGQKALAGPSPTQVAVYNKFTTVQPYDYLVFTDGTDYYAKSGNTGGELITNTTPDVGALLNSINGLATASSITLVAFTRGTFNGATTFAPSDTKGFSLTGQCGLDQETPATLINWTSTTTSFWDDTNYGAFKHANSLCLTNMYFTQTSYTGTFLNDSNGNINAYEIDNCTSQNISTPGNYVHTGVFFNPGFQTESNATSLITYTNLFGYHNTIVSGGGLMNLVHVQLGFFDGHGIEINGTGSPEMFIQDLKTFNIISPGVLIYDNRTTSPTSQSILFMSVISQENSSRTNYTNVNGAKYWLELSTQYIGIILLPVIQTNVGKGAIYNKSESGADTNLLTFTPPSDGAGGGASVVMYRVRFALSISAASSAVVGWTVAFTDVNGNAQTPTNLALFQMGTASPALTFTTSAASEYYADCLIAPDGLADIVVKFTLGSGTITAKASAEIEAV